MLRKTLALAIYLLIPFALAQPNSNPDTLVKLRIEGDTTTIFEGLIFTRGHDVETALGGKHHCDGTNLHTYPKPGPTCTSALDDASKLHHFEWDGPFFPEFDDYLVSIIDGVNQTSSKFWNSILNFNHTRGGCLQQVAFLDEVLWAFGLFEAPALKLAGPDVAYVGQGVSLTITDGKYGTPVAGASVDGQISDANGHVSVTFYSAGIQKVKAEKLDSIRSNRLEIVVERALKVPSSCGVPQYGWPENVLFYGDEVQDTV